MPYPALGELKSAAVIKRHPSNPVLSPDKLPYHSDLTYNAGVTKYQGRYVMIFREEDYDIPGGNGGRLLETCLGLAVSDNGIDWEVQTRRCLTVEQLPLREAERIYDPRLTVVDGKCVLCFALDTYHGLRGGIAVTEDFATFEIKSLSLPDNRNLVLFPEKIGGRYVRLERPFPMYTRGGNPWERTRFDLWLSSSPDLRDWGGTEIVLGVEHVPFANDKIGPAAPPVRTEKGWLTLFHAVDIDESRGKNGWEKVWRKRYCAGIMLLDLNDPARVIGLCREPLLAPEASYETTGGLRNNVIFPGGMILEDDGEVKIYYGAADTVECLATAHVDDLLALCEPVELTW